MFDVCIGIKVTIWTFTSAKGDVDIERNRRCFHGLLGDVKMFPII